ncbi:MAG: YceI family protein [Bacteroidetes bacterium]|nr:YceI family protein [Bacteroidota bacterium]
MKRIKSVILFIAVFAGSVNAQNIYFTKTAKVKLDATPENPVEEIEAINNEASSFVNRETGDVVFAVLVKSFRFQKALMEEHFNENYMESNKFPKSDFKGKISDLSAINFSKDGEYKAEVEGTLTMHGISKTVKAPVTFTVKGGKFSAVSSFKINLSDYGIERPSVVKDKISETATISIDASYEPKK